MERMSLCKFCTELQGKTLGIMETSLQVVITCALVVKVLYQHKKYYHQASVITHFLIFLTFCFHLP